MPRVRKPERIPLQFIEKRDWNDRRGYLVTRRDTGEILGTIVRSGRMWTASSGQRTTYHIPTLREAGEVLTYEVMK